MKTSELGFSLIKQFEGVRLTTYADPVGEWTIGYGHTLGVKPGMVITLEQAIAFLHQDIVTTESFINTLVTKPINQDMFDALVDFTFNVGQGNLQKSSLLHLLNLGDYVSAANGFLLWNRAGGMVQPGLTLRRRTERSLFLRGVALMNTTNNTVSIGDANNITNI